ncbi:MAG: hypothetical protein ACXWQO_13885 [Bdellovibrionota bacterium]
MKMPNPKIFLTIFTLTLLNVSSAHAFSEEHDVLLGENIGTACLVGGAIGAYTGRDNGAKSMITRGTVGCIALGAVGGGLVSLDIAKDEEELRVQEILNKDDDQQ